VEAWREVNDEILDALQAQFADEDTSTSIMVISGARGNISQVKQITGSVGIMTDATGHEIELPIKSSYKSGFSPLEYFTSTRGTRKGMISTALKTADSGYLTRRLVDVSQDIFTTDEKTDDPGFEITRTETEQIGLEFANRISGRVLATTLKDGSGKQVARKGTLISVDLAEQIAESDIESVKIMSVLSCTNLRGVSRESYGVDLATGEMVEAYQPVGVIAAQSIGEPGTQLTLDVFHAGGVAGQDISQGLPRVEELFEARSPKGQAYLAKADGQVSIWESGEAYIVQIVPGDSDSKTIKLNKRSPIVKSGSEVSVGDVIASKGDKDKHPITAPIGGVVEVFEKEIVIVGGPGGVLRYTIPNYKQLSVSDGDLVKKGDRLTNGSMNLQELMELKGMEATQRYIMNEVLSIFAAQGQTIADKHLEVVIRQMFSRVQIDEPGDSTFVIGDIVSKAAVVEENIRLVAEKKEPATYKQLLLGITKVSTWSDSFLAAASFQDTTRVLISAAISGKVDNLYGLKENVIIGRKIPVGTGHPLIDDLTDELTNSEASDKVHES